MSQIITTLLIRESESDYKPCYVDYSTNEFTSREFCLYSEVEEISLHDSVCWRIENSKESLGSVHFEFGIDLVCCPPPTSMPLEGDSQSGFLSEAVHEQGGGETVLVSISLHD